MDLGPDYAQKISACREMETPPLIIFPPTTLGKIKLLMWKHLINCPQSITQVLATSFSIQQWQLIEKKGCPKWIQAAVLYRSSEGNWTQPFSMIQNRFSLKNQSLGVETRMERQLFSIITRHIDFWKCSRYYQFLIQTIKNVCIITFSGTRFLWMSEIAVLMEWRRLKGLILKMFGRS